MTKEIWIWTIAVIAILLLNFYIAGLKKEIDKTQHKLDKTSLSLIQCQMSNALYKNSVEAQNKALKRINEENKKASEELEKWKNKTPEVKYKTIEKIREVKSDDCKDTKGTLDAVSTIDFNSL